MDNLYANNPWDNMPTPDGEKITYVKKGVLWVEKEPHYIIELIKEPDSTYVMIYAPHPNSIKNPTKKAKEVVINKDVFSKVTRLGQLANALIPVKQSKKWLPEEPLFVAPLIAEYTATLTGKKESGFFEREPDRTQFEAGELKIKRGRNTGVFIGMSSIEWQDGFTIPTKSILDTLTAYNQDIFYDLGGNNSDTGNPLSRYYKE